MDTYVKSITLDVNAVNNYTFVEAKQGDAGNRRIAISLKKDGANFAVSGYSKIQFRCEKPDGNIVIIQSTDSGSPITVSSNVYTVALSTQCLVVSGDVWCDLAFLDSSNNVLSSAAFVMRVVPMPNGNSAQSISEWTELQKAIDDAERFANIVAFRTSGNYIQYTVDGTTWVNLTTVGAIGGDLQTQINALNGAINAKTDYLDLGTVSATSDQGAIQQAFEAITIYDRPVAIRFSYNGLWSGLAFKINGGQYGTIYATIHIDGAVYFGYKRETTFTVYQNATKTDISALQTSLNAITPLDTVPTNGSTKGITSDAVYAALHVQSQSPQLTLNTSIAARGFGKAIYSPITRIVTVIGRADNYHDGAFHAITTGVIFTIPEGIRPIGTEMATTTFAMMDGTVNTYELALDQAGQIVNNYSANVKSVSFTACYRY